MQTRGCFDVGSKQSLDNVMISDMEHPANSSAEATTKCNRNDIQGIDLFKLLFALCVVVLHSTFFVSFKENFTGFVLYTFARYAVPFFLTTSGYLLFRKALSPTTPGKKSTIDTHTLLRYWLKTLFLYIIWCAVKATFCISIGMPLAPTLHDFFNLVLFVGYDVYWYLWAIFFAMPFFYLILLYYTKIGRASDFLLIVVACTIFYILVTHYEHAIDVPIYATPIKWYQNLYNYFCVGVIVDAMKWLCFGAFFAAKRQNLTPAMSIALIITGLFISGYGICNSEKITGINEFGVVLALYGLFPYILKTGKSISKAISITIRKMSAWIYFTHTIVIHAVFVTFDMSPWPKLLLIMSLCLLSSYCAVYAGKYKIFRWTNRMI